MPGLGGGEDESAFGVAARGEAVVDIVGCQQAEAYVVVLAVVLGEEVGAVVACVLW